MNSVDIKLLSWNVRKIQEPPDPELPFRMRLRCSHPALTAVRHTRLFGTYDEAVFQAKSLEAITASLQETRVQEYPLLVSVVIWNAEGKEVYRYPSSSKD